MRKGCSCETDLDLAPGEAAPGTRPWGSSLGRDALTSRISEWRALAAAATSAERASGIVRLALPAGPDTAAAVAALCAAETACSARARFTVEVTAGQIILTADAPGTPDLLDTLFPAVTPGLR